MTWKAFTRFLRNTIADPVNRMGTASLRLEKAEQREGQTVREFANYIEELEEDIPEMGIEEQRDLDASKRSAACDRYRRFTRE